MLANLSGFDGSPESLRQLQLEYGAEIGRAIVNFDGPIVFCVVSRYHGGAFVVFSETLNDKHGGARRRGLVRLGDRRRAGRGRGVHRARSTRAPRPTRGCAELESGLAAADGVEQARLARRARRRCATAVRSEKLGEVAAEFDAMHSIERAVAVGSVHAIIPAAELRPRLIAAVERGLARP